VISVCNFLPAEIGTHDELIRRGGEYAALWKTWTGSERPDES
jgi:ABC-type transport system involved in Fe-S cluster assembly fused permease/ATPase subunit